MGIDQLYEQVSNRDTEAVMEAKRLTELLNEVSGVRNNLTFLRSEIEHLLSDPEYDPDYPELLKVIHTELKSMDGPLEAKFGGIVNHDKR